MAKKEITDLPREKSFTKYKQLKFCIKSRQVPSVNHMYYNTRGGGKALKKEALDYMRDARAIINQAMEEQKWQLQPKGVWLYIDFVFHFPDVRIRDSHNCTKLLLDIMEGYIFENDMFAMPRIMSVEYDKDNPRVEVAVSIQSSQHREKSLQLIK